MSENAGNDLVIAGGRPAARGSLSVSNGFGVRRGLDQMARAASALRRPARVREFRQSDAVVFVGNHRQAERFAGSSVQARRKTGVFPSARTLLK